MRNIKLMLASSVPTIALVAGLSMPVGAQSAEANGAGNDTATSTETVNVDRSVNVNGNCSGVIYSSVDQTQQTTAGNLAGNLGGNVGGNLGGAVGESSNDQTTDQSTSQSNTQSNTVTNTQTAGVNFSPDCSVNNVTSVAATTTQAQVKTPVGGVHAGLGGGATTGSSMQAIFGLVGSLGTTGLGMGLKFFKKEL